MSGLNIKGTFMLFSILAVHGKIYQEDRYLMDSNHVESYHRLYSDNDRSDIFDDNDSKFPFDVPHPEIEDHDERSLSPLPETEEDNNKPDIIENLDVDKGFSNVFQDDKMINFADPRPFNFDFLKGFPDIFPVDNRLDQNQRRPVWMPNDVNDDNRPSWFPGGNTEGGNKIPINKPGRGEMKRKCRNIKGIPSPESGCCGVQMTRPPFVYPNKPWRSQYPGGRFVRSADSEILPTQMISGGKAADLHQFPWMVHLSLDSVVSGTSKPSTCGGTIISSRYVITAAHCLNGIVNLKQIAVILAEYNTDTYPKDCNGQGCIMNKKKSVEHAIIHPKFNSKYLQNDIALLRLSSDIDYSDYIRPVCLPTKDIAEQSKEPLVISGWGSNGKMESSVKRSATVNYVPDDKCKEAYAYKEDSMFCSIGGNGEDICHGDSGGPLMMHSGGKYFLSGVVNGKRADQECGSTTVPSFFNNVFYHLDWIKKHVQ